jgi:hypothetical protein
MSDEIPPPPFVYDGLDPALAEKSVLVAVADAVKGTAQRIGEAVDSGRKPGMPLSVLSNIAREAPLGSLLIALLLGCRRRKAKIAAAVRAASIGRSTQVTSVLNSGMR